MSRANIEENDRAVSTDLVAKPYIVTFLWVPTENVAISARRKGDKWNFEP